MFWHKWSGETIYDNISLGRLLTSRECEIIAILHKDNIAIAIAIWLPGTICVNELILF